MTDTVDLTTLLTQSNATSNLFEVAFIDAFDAETKFRVIDFTPPVPSVGTSKLVYKNVDVTIPAYSYKLNREQTLNIRVGSNYYEYMTAKALMNSLFNPLTGMVGAGTSFQVKVTLDNTITPSATPSWLFTSCKIIEVKLPAFAYNSATPVVATIKFTYTHFDVTPTSTVPAIPSTPAVTITPVASEEIIPPPAVTPPPPPSPSIPLPPRATPTLPGHGKSPIILSGHVNSPTIPTYPISIPLS